MSAISSRLSYTCADGQPRCSLLSRPLVSVSQKVTEGSGVRFFLDLFSLCLFFFSSRRRHTRSLCDWSSDVCSSDLCLRHQIPVVPIAGPSALLASLSASGMPTEEFLFVGFLPARSGERRRALERLRIEERTIILYEAPHRVEECIAKNDSALFNAETFEGALKSALSFFTKRRTASRNASQTRWKFLATGPHAWH